MKNRWRIIAILCLVLGLLLLGGCAEKEKQTNKQPKNTDGYTTRGEWLSMLAEGFGLYTYQSETPYYSDIEANNRLFASVQSLAEWDVLSIYSNGTLKADKPVTRQEVASTAAIAAGFRANDNGELSVEDSVSYAIENGIVTSGDDLAGYMTIEECETAIENARKVYLTPPTEEVISVTYSEALIDLSGIPANRISTQKNKVIVSGLLLADVAWDADDIATVTILAGSELVEISAGNTVVLAPTAEHQAGAAYKITDILLEKGDITLITETPTIADFYDELIVHTTVVADENSFIWANGVTTTDIPANGLSATGQDSGYHIEILSYHQPELQLISSSVATYRNNVHFSWGNGARKLASIINSDVLGYGQAARMLNNSNFVYTGTPSISDFGNSTRSWELELSRTNKYETGYKITGDISIELQVTADVEYHKLNLFGIEISLWPKSASLSVASNIASDLTLEGKLSDTLEIAKISIPIGATGLTVEGTLSLYADASGTVKVKLELANSEKVEWNDTAGFRHVSGNNNANSDIQATVDLDIGAEVSLSLCAFSVEMIGADLKAGAEVETDGKVVGRCEEQIDNGNTVRSYTESIKLSSTLYLPVVTLTVSGPEHLSDVFGLEKTWEIVGKGSGAKRYTIFDEEWEFWKEKIIIAPDGEVIDRETTTAGSMPGEGPTDEEILAALLNGDFSYFAGTYTPYDIFSDYFGSAPMSDIVLADNGIITGGTSYGWYEQGQLKSFYSPYAGRTPISVTREENGAYTCVVTRNGIIGNSSGSHPNDYYGEYYVIYPVGVGGSHYDFLGIDTIRMNYVIIDGGVLDIMYYKN